jgi:tetratricopeptide (TPR) repeat protein
VTFGVLIKILTRDMQVARLFNEAAQMAPEDADVHIVLGVLYNLSREYDKAIAFFQTALKLKPQDYSLWNKLGATQANSVQSADAILAYQQVYLYTSKNSCLFGLLWYSLPYLIEHMHLSQNKKL